MKKLLVTMVLAVLVAGCNDSQPAKTAVKEEPTATSIQATATLVPTYTPVPTNTPVPTATPIPPTSTPVPVPDTPTPAPALPTATPVPPSPTPQISDREALVIFLNQAWPIVLQADAADVQLSKSLSAAGSTNDVINAIDKWVKATEPLIPQLKALTAPNVPFAQAFLDRYTKAMDGYFDATKRVNWGIVKNDSAIFDQAIRDLNAASKDATQAYWEVKAAVEKQGLTYNVQKKQWQ